MTESGVAFQITVDGTTVAVEGIRGYFQSRRAGLDAHLVTRLAAFLDDAHDTIDCAIYDLRHPRILTALADAVARGVRVRIVYDGGKARASGRSADPKPDGTEAALARAGLLPYATAAHTRGRHLMHDKFVLRDGRDVWVGSANFTEGGLELQDNACLTLSSRPLAARFATTFEALLQASGRRAPSADESESVTVGSTAILPLFAPAAGESIERQIVAAIRDSRKIRITAFLLSDPGILQALAPLAHFPQFDIRGVYDPHGMEDVLRYTSQDDALFWFMRDPRFVAAPSHAFSAEREQDFMHNKTLVIDNQLVFTGSYNFSENAEANDEVVLRIESEALAAAYGYYCDVLFTAYGGVIEAPQTSKRLSGGPRPRVNSTPLPVVTSPRLKAVTAPPARGATNTNPRLPAISAPIRRSTPPPQPPMPTPTVAEVAAASPLEVAVATPATPAESAADRRIQTQSRALDILILVVRVKIAVVLLALIAYLLLSGIIHL